MTAAADFRTLFEATPGLCLGLLPDAPRFTIVAVSDGCARALAMPREAIVGRGLFEVFRERVVDAQAGGEGALRASLARVLATRSADTMAARQHRVRRSPQQGGGEEPRWWTVVHAAALDADGGLRYIVQRIEDVTDAVQAKSEEYWHGLFVHASDAIFLIDATGRCADANEAACRLMQRRRDAVVGRAAAELLAPGDAERYAGVRQRMREGVATVNEWTLQRADGRKVPVEASMTLLSDGCCLCLARDITDRQRREQALQASADELERRVAERTRELRRLAADLEAAEGRERRQIARDLHDDLAQTLAAASMHLAGLRGDERAEVRAAAQVVSDLVDEAGRATRSLAAQLAPAVLFDLGLLPALEWLAGEIGRSFGLRVDIADDGRPKPLAEQTRSVIYRAVRELLINVAKHAGVRQAEVRLQCDGGVLTVTVSDGGVGFAPADAVRSRRTLGLASVRERLSYIGGSFELRSIPGDGTQATLRAPLEPDTPNGDAA